MKKITVLTCLWLLCACSSTTTTPSTTTQTRDTSKETSTAELQYINTFYGATSEHGFYRIAEHEDNGDTYQNIMYLDYESKQEIYLCEKPECTHRDHTCTSFVKDAFFTRLFYDGDSLYLLHLGASNTMGLDQSQRVAPFIEKRDIDGSHAETIYQLPEGFQFTESFAIGNHTLYIPVNKVIYVQSGTSSQGITTQQQLFAIDLDTGSQSNLGSINYQNLIAAEGRTLIFQTTNFKEDIEQYLKNEDYEAYNNAFYNSYVTFTSYDIDQKTYTTPITNIEDGATVYDQGHLYSIDRQNQLIDTSMDSGAQRVLAQLDQNKDYAINTIQDGKVVVDAFEKTTDNAAYVGSYLYDGTLQEFDLHRNNPLQPILVLAKVQDTYFVLYDHEGVERDTWAGTKQFETTRSYWGLIKQSDFWSNQPNYQAITSDWVF